MPGTLFIVATPIGNLEDFTFRALRTLNEVNLIAAEDTRRTSKLLAHYEVSKPLVSIREHNEAQGAARLIERLKAGDNVAYVTDAGTPGIADPGARLVSAARAAAIPVVPIPGPSAVAAAVSVAGFPTDEFAFMGFPPSSGAARTEWLERLAAEVRLVVFFESPHRASRLIGDMTAYTGQRRFMAFRELTKIYESAVISPIEPQQLTAMDRGELTIVLEPLEPATRSPIDEVSAGDMFGRLTDVAGFDADVALEMLAAALNAPENVVRKAVKRARILANQRRQSEP